MYLPPSGLGEENLGRRTWRTFFDLSRTFFKPYSKGKSPPPTRKVLLKSKKSVGLWNIPVNLSSQVHLWSSGLWMLEEYFYYNFLNVQRFKEANMATRGFEARKDGVSRQRFLIQLESFVVLC